MMGDRWRLIRSGACSGADNMALDEALLEAVRLGVSPPVLRLYRWSPATVTLGYFQKGQGVVNLEACRELGFDVVRRVTGGRAVLHDREVTYAVIAPADTAVFPGGVCESYRVIARALHRALAGLGLPATLATGRCGGVAGEGAEQSACFTAASRHELLLSGCKITGNAQRRRGGALLQHGSIPLEMDLEALYRALDTSGARTPTEGAALLARTVGWVNRFAAAAVSADLLEESLAIAFPAELGMEFDPSEPTSSELESAARLKKEKYCDPAWNLAGID